MYTKIFRQIYDGTLSADWKALIVFQQFLIIADKDGMINMTTDAIHRITNIPHDVIKDGIKTLMLPDKNSRSSQNEGRRIILIDPNRDWGWLITNYKYYHRLSSYEDKKEKDRLRISEKRNKNKDVARCRKVSQSVRDVAHVSTNTKKIKKKRSFFDFLKNFFLKKVF